MVEIPVVAPDAAQAHGSPTRREAPFESPASFGDETCRWT